MAVWHCREKEIEYGSKVLLMGIVNVTPDSFSDGGDGWSRCCPFFVRRRRCRCR